MSNVKWLALAVLLGVGASGRVVAAEETATVKQDRVNVRGQATLNSEVITQLRKGESITVLEEVTLEKPKPGEPARWLKILLPANTPVWVHSTFIDPNTKAVLPTRLNVRAGPGENFSVVGRLSRGDTVKEIRRENNWLEIEPPPGTAGFVSADLLTRGTAVAAAPEPSKPAPEPAKAKKAKADEPARVAAAPAPEPAPAAAPVPGETAPPPAKEPGKMAAAKPAPAEPAPAASPEPAKPEAAKKKAARKAEDLPPPKRIVRREGQVRPTVSVQAPTYYGLANPATGALMNYLYTDSETLHLNHLKGFRIVVTGEEYVDKRWPKTPIIKIETLEVAP